MDSVWQQQGNEPLFPDVIWSRPERKTLAGKLLILGGHTHGFDALGRAYQAAVESGVGEVKAALPDKLKATLSNILPDAVFAASTPTGNLSQAAFDAVNSYIEWASATLIMQTGDNSETALLVNQLFQAHPNRKFILSDDALQLLSADIDTCIKQSERLWVLSFAGVQKLAMLAKSQSAFLATMGVRPFVLALNELQQLIQQPIVSIYDDTIIVAADGKVVSTKRAKQPDITMLSGSMAVWWLQQPQRSLEALTSAAFEF